MSDENSDAGSQQRFYAEDERGSTVVFTTRKFRGYGNRRFVTMFEEGFQRLARMDRPPVYYRTLFQGLELLDPVQYRRVSARELAEAAGMSLNSAQRACAMLEADRVFLTKGNGSGKSLRLNNRIAWAARADQWATVEPDPEVIDARGRP